MSLTSLPNIEYTGQVNFYAESMSRKRMLRKHRHIIKFPVTILPEWAWEQSW